MHTLLAMLFAVPAIPPLVWIPEPPPAVQRNDATRRAAERMDEQTRTLYDAGDLSAALDAAETAFAAWPNAYTAIVRATILEDLSQPERAFTAWMQAGDLGPTTEERQRIDEALRRLGPGLSPPRGWLVLDLEPAHGRVTVLGFRVPVGRTIGLIVGAHDVHLSAEGFRDQSVRVEIRAGMGARLRLVLVVSSESAPSAVEERGEPPARSGWVAPTLGGAGAVLLASSVAAGVWTSKAVDRASDHAGPVLGMTEDDRRLAWEDARDDVGLRRTLTWTLAGIGAAAGAAGLVIGLRPFEGSAGGATASVAGRF